MNEKNRIEDAIKLLESWIDKLVMIEREASKPGSCEFRSSSRRYRRGFKSTHAFFTRSLNSSVAK